MLILRASLINLATVRDSRHINRSGAVINDIDYSVITNANPPFLVAAP